MVQRCRGRILQLLCSLENAIGGSCPGFGLIEFCRQLVRFCAVGFRQQPDKFVLYGRTEDLNSLKVSGRSRCRGARRSSSYPGVPTEYAVS